MIPGPKVTALLSALTDALRHHQLIESVDVTDTGLARAEVLVVMHDGMRFLLDVDSLDEDLPAESCCGACGQRPAEMAARS